MAENNPPPLRDNPDDQVEKPPISDGVDGNLPENSSSSHPTNFRAYEVAGYVAGMITLVFLMVIAFLPVIDHSIPCSGRFPVLIVLAFGSAMAFSFIGGSAAAKGQVPLPFGLQTPVQFGVGGGIAVIIVVLLIGWALYVKDCHDEDPAYRVRSIEDRVDLSRVLEARGPNEPVVERTVTLQVERLHQAAADFETRVGTSGVGFDCQILSGNASCYRDVKRPNPDRQVWIISANPKDLPLHVPTTISYHLKYFDPNSFQFPTDQSGIEDCRHCEISIRVPPYAVDVYNATLQFPSHLVYRAVKRVVTPPNAPSVRYATDFFSGPEIYQPPPLKDLKGHTAVSFYIALNRQ